ncbi:MAG: hypothetical protein LBF63_02680, partial [Treponema sp.]|nr:hypothetical protein [Treponema sp.]
MSEFANKMNGRPCSRGTRRRRGLLLRIAALSFAAALLVGAVVLVSFAIISPELPPENLISTINDIAAYYDDPDNDWSISPLVLPQEEKN